MYVRPPEIIVVHTATAAAAIMSAGGAQLYPSVDLCEADFIIDIPAAVVLLRIFFIMVVILVHTVLTACLLAF